MFRKLNKPHLTKIKQQILIGQRPFDSRSYLDISMSFKWKESFIFRYFKVFEVSQMFTYAHSLEIEKGRHFSIPRANRVYLSCKLVK